MGIKERLPRRPTKGVTPRNDRKNLRGEGRVFEEGVGFSLGVEK